MESTSLRQQFIPVGQKAKLEAELMQDAGAPPVAAVVLHPFGALGGSMNDPVVAAMFRKASESGAFHKVLRYNMRGVGSSTGPLSLRGNTDIQDVQEVVRFVTEKTGLDASNGVVLLTYSWGSCVASHALGCRGVIGFVSLGFPRGRVASIFLGSRRHWSVCVGERHRHIPKLFVIGTRDQFWSADILRHKLDKEADAGALVQLRVLPGVDHSFVSRGGGFEDVEEAVEWAAELAWLSRTEPPSPVGMMADAAGDTEEEEEEAATTTT